MMPVQPELPTKHAMIVWVTKTEAEVMDEMRGRSNRSRSRRSSGGGDSGACAMEEGEEE